MKFGEEGLNLIGDKLQVSSPLLWLEMMGERLHSNKLLCRPGQGESGGRVLMPVLCIEYYY